MAMTRRRQRPNPDDVRCPKCHSVAWRRAGERVVEVNRPGLGSELRHEFTRDGEPFEWTCERCGYSVRAADQLDRALSRVQVVGLAGLLAGLLGRRRAKADASAEASGTAGTTARTAALGTTVAAVAIVAGLVVFGGGLRPNAPPSASSSAATGSSLPAASNASASSTATPASSASTSSGGARSPSADALTSVGDISGLSASAAGRAVDIGNATVVSVSGDAAFWIGSDSERVLVIASGRAPSVKAGQHVRISGTVEAAPPAGVDLSVEDKTALGDQALYVRADAVEVISP